MKDKFCSLCERQAHNRTRFEKHHVIPKQVFHYRKGYPEQKVVWLCWSCHGWIHSRFTNIQLKEMNWQDIKIIFESPEPEKEVLK